MQCQSILSGGGLYYCSIKVGKWIELSDGFWNQSQITYCGDYKQGKKVGKWDIYWKQGESNNQMYIFINQYIKIQVEGDLMMIWLKVFQQKLANGLNQVIVFIVRRKLFFLVIIIMVQKSVNGILVGNKMDRINVHICNMSLQQISNLLNSGGGQYEKIKEISVKVGKWIELSDCFWNQSQITYCGDYKNNGQKVGRWDTYWKFGESNNKIGGGQYDDLVDGITVKIGNWIELRDGFQLNQQVIFNGDYNYGRKIGKWDIYWKQVLQSFKIGGGSYEAQLNQSSIKIGQWTELSNNYSLDSQIYNCGVYKKGIKIGKWEIHQQLKLIGGGSYIDGIKTGEWIELCDGFYKSDYGSNEITFNGKYKNGQKIGKWTQIKFKNIHLSTYYYN
ncbi:unnamed protein product [Paramecium sonneborni]|uniref:Uncharacterized protein n=1 Tax=Paramecium sonneborni TaxID=65129 RepID=A0A8S1LTX6_9CILI|nr:unnamed protein product [Paramecium sonneborni]